MDSISKSIADLARYAEHYGFLLGQAEHGKVKPSEASLTAAVGRVHTERERLLASIREYVSVEAGRRFEAGVDLALPRGSSNGTPRRRA